MLGFLTNRPNRVPELQREFLVPSQQQIIKFLIFPSFFFAGSFRNLQIIQFF